MNPSLPFIELARQGLWIYEKGLKLLVYALNIVAGLGILTMMVVTCLDIVMRIFGTALIGAYDIVKLTGAVTIACALPYTTAVKGHVAIEFFFLKLNRYGRIVVDSVCRSITMMMFGFLSWRCIQYGISLKVNGEVTPTLQLPTFWVLYVIAFSCGVVVLVTFYHLLRPGKEMIKP
ncbi:MAG: TRAP transporter small permease [Candidatus Omnitrophota bacterium]|jgi:TRAP-type C4-dicarboxylate transport system permease small subunit|nr:MAG: TRAP transporter small permease [Candidatus Omnitrophota bacterium]